jgi:hypothetical protein
MFGKLKTFENVFANSAILTASDVVWLAKLFNWQFVLKKM